MKRISFLLVLTIFIASCNNTTTPEQDTKAATEETGPQEGLIEIAIIDVTGMHCDGCVNTVTSALSGLEGVSDAKVSLEYEQAKVKFDPAKVSADDFKAAIIDSGYGTGEIKIVKSEDQKEKQAGEPTE